MKVSSYSPEYDKLRTWMMAKREESGLSLRDVGRLMGRHHSVIGKMEQDRRKVDIVEFVQYCQVIEADPLEGIQLLQKLVIKHTKGQKTNSK